MIWGLFLSCLLCNNDPQTWETGWRAETGWGWDDSGVDCSPWISVRDAEDKAVASLDFGTVSAVDSVTVDLTLTNKGDCDLVIEGLSVEGDGFSSSALEALIVEPDAALPLTVSFTPTGTGLHQGELVILSNDPFDTEYIIELSGSLANGNMTSETTSLDFGELAVGCEAEQTVVIGNSGPGPIQIDEVLSDVTAFEVASDSLPKTLEPNDELTLIVRYAPTDEGEDSGLISVFSDDAGEKELQIAAAGSAVFSDWNTDEFTGNGSNRVFILDNVAVEGTVSVRVSAVLAAGWSFDTSANAVVFDEGNAPAADANIQINYATHPVCD